MGTDLASRALFRAMSNSNAVRKMLPRKVVSITCPTKRALVPTGLEMTEPDFAIALLRGRLLEACPACGGPHVWQKKDARLVEFEE